MWETYYSTTCTTPHAGPPGTFILAGPGLPYLYRQQRMTVRRLPHDPRWSQITWARR